MRYSRFISVSIAGLALTVAACGDNPLGVNSGDALSDAEIQALFNQMGDALGDVSPSANLVAALDGIQLAEISVDESVSVTAPCQSGTISVDGSVSGTVDDQTFESDLTMGVTLDFAACVVPADSITVTVDGQPDITYSAHFRLTQDSLVVDGSQLGGFSFTTSDGRAGSCAIDVTFDASYATGSAAVSTVSGTVCGRSASQFEAYTGT